jgi:hypothetical protein
VQAQWYYIVKLCFCFQNSRSGILNVSFGKGGHDEIVVRSQSKRRRFFGRPESCTTNTKKKKEKKKKNVKTTRVDFDAHANFFVSEVEWKSPVDHKISFERRVYVTIVDCVYVVYIYIYVCV